MRLYFQNFTKGDTPDLHNYREGASPLPSAHVQSTMPLFQSFLRGRWLTLDVFARWQHYSQQKLEISDNFF